MYMIYWFCINHKAPRKSMFMILWFINVEAFCCLVKKGYKEKIVDIGEEILRNRRVGKLLGYTTFVLKVYWKSHSKWSYPTEEDKARLVKKAGLQLKQISNWFTNERKRNWNSTSSSSTVLKNKRERNAGDSMELEREEARGFRG